MTNFLAGGSSVRIRQPFEVSGGRRPTAATFAVLYSLEAMTRATLATVISLDALTVLGDAQKVSVLFFAASLTGLIFAFAVPGMVRLTNRRLVYGLGALLLFIAPFLMATGYLSGQVAGLMIRTIAVVCLSICLNLYIMDYIPRRELSNSEPLRMFYSAWSWTVGPFLGVYLANEVARWAPYALSAFFALVLFGYFWFLRMPENPALPHSAEQPHTPVYNLRRFFSQPRLALAWLISTSRAAWWVMFLIYAPIYAVTSGLGEVVAGFIVSLGFGFLFLMPFWGRCARRFGLRRLFVAGFAATGLATIGAGFAAGVPWLGAAFLVGAAFCMVSVDSGGNILFFRAVRPRERSEMAPVFGTYMDFSQLATPGAFSLLLRHFELWGMFLAVGLSTVGIAFLSRYIPRRM